MSHVCPKNQILVRLQPGIAGAYKRKEYGWFVAYISVAVLATRLGGALGAAMSILVMAALYKIIKNTSYSTTKKILLSMASIVGGLVATYLAFILIVQGIYHVFGAKTAANLDPRYREAQARTLSVVPFNSSSTPSLGAQFADATQNLEAQPYTDARFGFGTKYPKGWTIDNSGTNANIEFDDPSSDELALITVSAEEVKGFDLSTYTKNVIQGFESAAGSYADPRILSQGTATLDGEPAYEFEITADYINNSKDSRYTAYISFPSIPTLATFIQHTRWNRYGPSIGRYSTRPRHPSASSMELFRKNALAV